MFLWRNNRNISTFRLRKVPYQSYVFDRKNLYKPIQELALGMTFSLSTIFHGGYVDLVDTSTIQEDVVSLVIFNENLNSCLWKL